MFERDGTRWLLVRKIPAEMDSVTSAIPGAILVVGGGKPERSKRVRSQVRKRGGRGKGKGKKGGQPNGAAENHSSISRVLTSNGHSAQPDGEEGTPSGQKRKRSRERKNRQWKPWSEQTWQERLARENFEEERAAALEAAQQSKPDSPSHKKKKKKRNNEYVDIPRAPRNPTQNLIPDEPEEEEGGRMDQPSSVPSMQGLLSRKMVSFTESRGEGDSSDDDDDVAHPMSPHFDTDDDAPSPACLPEAQEKECNGLHEDERDKKLRELEDENKALRDRLAELERAQRKA